MKKEERQAALKKELVGRLIKNLAKTEPTIISQISPEAKGMSYPESYRAKPCLGGFDRCPKTDHEFYHAEDVEREMRSADALLLSCKQDLARQRAEHEKEQTAIIGSLKELDGKIRELDEVMHDMSDVSDAWQHRAEAAEKISNAAIKDHADCCNKLAVAEKKLAELQKIMEYNIHFKKKAEARVRELEAENSKLKKDLQMMSDAEYEASKRG